jgi:hypothetical protein
MHEFEQPKLTLAAEAEVYDALAERLALEIHKWFEEEALDEFDLVQEVDTIANLLGDDEDWMDVYHTLWTKAKKKFANMILDNA